MKRLLILRKKSVDFISIEKVFAVLIPYLKVQKLELPYESVGFINRLYNFLFLLKKRTHFIHLSGHEHYLFTLPLFKKSVLTIHDVEGLYRLKGWRRFLFKKLWLEWPIRNAKVVTTVSRFSRAEIESIIRTAKTIHYIPNPLTLPLTYSPHLFNLKKPTILQIGTKENKNVFRLIEAIKGINCRLIIIGQESDELKGILKSYGIDYTLKSNLSNADMIAEYNASDLLAFVSTYEGFGLPILEAQAVGRPVITSKLASMPEVAGEGALLVDPYSVEDIREGVLKLIHDEKLRESLIQKGLENVKRFDAESIARQYRDVYALVDKS